MFENNPTINNLYNRMVEFKKEEDELLNKKINIYSTFFICSMINLCILCSILDKNSQNNILIYLSIAFIFVSLFLLLTCKPFFLPFSLWSKHEKLLAEKIQQIISDIFQEKTQIELINFKFKHIKDSTITDFKESLMSKQYQLAYQIFFTMLEREIYCDEIETNKSARNKLIEDYELSLKMKL